MNLHEYQAKTILSNFDVPIQRGKVTENIDEVENSIRKKIIEDKKINYLSKLLTGYESLDEL